MTEREELSASASYFLAVSRTIADGLLKIDSVLFPVPVHSIVPGDGGKRLLELTLATARAETPDQALRTGQAA